MKKRVLEIQHIDFFKKEGSILFHNLLDSLRLPSYRDCLSKLTARRNVWKHSTVLRKLSFNPSLAALAGSLVGLKKLRFGFDHFFPSFENLKNFFALAPSLNSLASIDGLEIALLLNLSDEKSPPYQTLSTLPSIGGSGMFFNTTVPFPLFSEEDVKGPFLLLVYSHANARYSYKVTDPFTHDVKKESCVFGDRLANAYHPLLYY
jgi:hypothetical protein